MAQKTYKCYLSYIFFPRIKMTQKTKSTEVHAQLVMAAQQQASTDQARNQSQPRPPVPNQQGYYTDAYRPPPAVRAASRTPQVPPGWIPQQFTDYSTGYWAVQQAAFAATVVRGGRGTGNHSSRGARGARGGSNQRGGGPKQERPPDNPPHPQGQEYWVPTQAQMASLTY